MSVFGIVPFSSSSPQKLTKATKMGSQNLFFRESDHLMGKCQNFTIKLFMRTTIHIFLSSLIENDKAEVTKPVYGIHHQKNLSFGPFFEDPGAILPKILWNFLHAPAKFCPNLPSSAKDIHKNVFYDHYNIGLKLSPTINCLPQCTKFTIFEFKN